MSRPLRIEFAGALYHVMARGNAQAAIYEDDDDRVAWLENLGRVCGRYDWRVWAYCLMDNHYHILVETGRPTLSRGMREVNGVYSQAFNRRHGRVGHVLQGRYKALMIDKDAYLLELSRYIVLNPVRAGLVAEVGTWTWSSYLAVAGKALPPDWLAVPDALKLFHAEPTRARRAYIRFVADGVGAPDPSNDVQRQLFLGGERFVELQVRKLGKQPQSREVPRRQRPVPSLSAYERQSDSRDTAIREAYDSGGYTLEEIGSYFGLHYSVVSRIARGCYKSLAEKT